MSLRPRSEGEGDVQVRNQAGGSKGREEAVPSRQKRTVSKSVSDILSQKKDACGPEEKTNFRFLLEDPTRTLLPEKKEWETSVNGRLPGGEEKYNPSPQPHPDSEESLRSLLLLAAKEGPCRSRAKE